MTYSKEVETLLSEGSKLYAAKEYEQASEKYAEACESFSISNGQDDADLLLLYGKALFQGAVSRSEVFGGAQGAANKSEEVEKKDEEDGNFQFCDDGPLAEEEEEEEEEENNEINNEENEEQNNEEDNSSSGEDDEAPNEEEQSDFEIAWEILDLTRALFEQEREQVINEKDQLTSPYLKSDTEESTNKFIILTKKLSETYDLLGEVSLESENFVQSAKDLEKCLNLRLELYEPNSSLISESHYKLSLALEFCVEDENSKVNAIKHLKLAIKSVQFRNDNEKDLQKKKDNEELIQDLSIKLEELEKESLPEFDEEKLDIIKGLLGQPTGENSSTTNQSKKANDLTSSVKKTKRTAPVVNDLTSMVKKRKVPKEEKKK